MTEHEWNENEWLRASQRGLRETVNLRDAEFERLREEGLKLAAEYARDVTQLEQERDAWRRHANNLRDRNIRLRRENLQLLEQARHGQGGDEAEAHGGAEGNHPEQAEDGQDKDNQGDEAAQGHGVGSNGS